MPSQIQSTVSFSPHTAHLSGVGDSDETRLRLAPDGQPKPTAAVQVVFLPPTPLMTLRFSYPGSARSKDEKKNVEDHDQKNSQQAKGRQPEIAFVPLARTPARISDSSWSPGIASSSYQFESVFSLSEGGFHPKGHLPLISVPRPRPAHPTGLSHRVS